MVKKDKKSSNLKKTTRTLIIIVIIVLILVFVVSKFVIKSSGKGLSGTILKNPLEKIIASNTNEAGEVDKDKIIEQGVLEFDEDYINYVLISSGIGNLHKSALGYGNPSIEIVVGDELWSAEIDGNNLITQETSIDDEDFRIIVSKEIIVTALLDPNPQEYLRDLFISGEIQAELVAGNTELFSKGYLSMYNDLTGG